MSGGKAIEGGKTIEGGCLCGELRYRIDGPVAWICHCHCTMCRRAAGALAVTWATVRLADFKVVQGELASYRSSSFAERGSCPRCGGQISFRSDHEPDTIDVSLGSFDAPDAYPADRHTYIGTRVRWLHLDEHLPGFTAGSPRAGSG